MGHQGNHGPEMTGPLPVLMGWLAVTAPPDHEAVMHGRAYHSTDAEVISDIKMGRDIKVEITYKWHCLLLPSNLPSLYQYYIHLYLLYYHESNK